MTEPSKPLSVCGGIDGNKGALKLWGHQRDGFSGHEAIHKMKNSLRELRETMIWLKIIGDKSTFKDQQSSIVNQNAARAKPKAGDLDRPATS